jgi:hypothetical protein
LDFYVFRHLRPVEDTDVLRRLLQGPKQIGIHPIDGFMPGFLGHIDPIEIYAVEIQRHLPQGLVAPLPHPLQNALNVPGQAGLLPRPSIHQGGSFAVG